MSRKITYFILSLFLLTHYSCEDYMELQPSYGLIREEFWQNQGDVEAVLMAAYQRFAQLNDKLFIYGEVRADMVMDAGNLSGRERDLAEANIYSNNNFCDWSDFYKVINNCNEVIANAEGVQEIDNTFSSFERERYVSEAIFLRSLAYFYLVRIFKEVPLVLEPSESDDTDFYLEKSSEDVILDQIVSDLIENRRGAPSGDFITPAENKGRASKAAFDALLADISLWRFDYDAVIEYVGRIEATGEFVLLPDSRYFELFSIGNTIESIFEFQFSDALEQPNKLYDLTNENDQQYMASQTAIEFLSRDYTTELYRGENVSIVELNEGEFYIWKYVGRIAGENYTPRSSSNQNSCNFIIYRYADVLLMKAEALSQKANPDFNSASNLINEVRGRAGMPALNISNTPAAFEDAIMAERAKEFCFEGKRWFELLRMGRRNDYARKSELIDVILTNVPSAQKRVLAVKLTDPNGWYLPIYEQEIERNFKLVQNPYYDI